MSAEGNKAVVSKLFAAVNASDIEQMLGLVTDDIVTHTPIPGVEPGREGFRDFMSVFFTAFPEQRVEIHDSIAEGDRVAVRHTHFVTHGGVFIGIPASGKQAIVTGIEIFRITNGKVAEMWHHDDLLSLLQQLDALPAPGADSNPGAR